MKTLKSVLGMLVALCLVLCLAVPAFADEATNTTGASTGPSADSTEQTTGDPASTEPTGGSNESEKETTPPEDEDSSENTDPTETAASTVTTGTGEAKTSTWKTVLLILEVIISVVLIIVVLLQSGKESGLGSTISGNSESYMSKNKKRSLDKMLASATKWVALVWVGITLALGLVK